MPQIDDILDVSALKELVGDGYISLRRHKSLPMVIYNYTDKATYEQVWTPETIMCRGLVVGDDGKVHARPFPKFFNVAEHRQKDHLPSLPPLGEAQAREKVDGSLIIGFTVDGRTHAATRGSFHSDQAVWASPRVQSLRRNLSPRYTYLFEGVYPQNRIVVDYGNTEELVLLAILDNEDGRNHTYEHADLVAAAEELEIRAARKPHEAPSEQMLIPSNAEGWVLEWPDGTRAKVKSDEYVELHRIIFGMSPRTIWSLLGEDLESGRDRLAKTIQMVPSDLADNIYTVADILYERLGARKSEALDDYMRIVEQMPDEGDERAIRKLFAAEATKMPEPSLLFSLLDGKPIDDLIWRSLKPESTASIYDPTGRFEQTPDQ